MGSMVVMSKTTGLKILLLLSSCCSLTLALTDTAVEVRPTTEHLKKHQSRHLMIYYPREFHSEVPALAQAAEVFLTDLAAKWSVILPNVIPVTMGTQEPDGRTWAHFEAPSWMHSDYDRNYRRIELTITRPLQYDGRIVADALKHQLVHYLLNLKQGNRLPPFLEEGLAQQYGRPPRSRDRYLAIWGCFRHDELQPFLRDEKTFESRYSFYSAAALSRLFVSWLWQEHPAGETQFLQSFLRGLPWEDALSGAGFKTIDALFPVFESSIRPSHRFYFLFLTLDFWVISLGLATLIYMVFRLTVAFRTARTPYVQVGVLALIEENLPEAGEFSGPAFAGAVETLPAAPPRRAAPAAAVPQTNPFADLDEDMDAVFSQLDNPFNEIDGELDDLFSNLNVAEQAELPEAAKAPAAGRNRRGQAPRSGQGRRDEPARSPSPSPSPSLPLLEEDAIESDLDRLFGDWAGESNPRK